MQTASSWTRENTTGNTYTGNSGSEQNATTGLYETFFRGYDAALGRFAQVDPLASKYHNQTPYQFGNNDPVYWSDASGAGGDARVSQSASADAAFAAGNAAVVGGMYGAVWNYQTYGSTAGVGGSTFALREGVNYWGSYGTPRFREWANVFHIAALIEKAIRSAMQPQNTFLDTESPNMPTSGTNPITASQNNLDAFVKKNFGSSYKRYDQKWVLDKDGKYAKGRYIKDGVERDNPGTTRRENGGIVTYINPDAFESEEKLYMVTGHEIVHSYLWGSGQMDRWYDRYGDWAIVGQISEFYAHSWSVQTAHTLGYSEFENPSFDVIMGMFGAESIVPIMDVLRDVNLNGLDIWHRPH